MSRILALAALVLAAVALLVLVAIRGADLFTEPPNTSTEPDNNGLPVADSAPRPPQYVNWPTPSAVLVLTGEAHGYLEPCGCAEKQSGGMARRSDLMRQLRGKGWPVAGLDLGGTVKRARKQSEYKFAAVTKAMRQLDYRALGLGPEELRLQPAFLLSEHVVGDEPSEGLVFLGANQTFFGIPDLDGGPRKLAIFDLGDVKIGATMILGESRQRGLYPEGAAADVSFEPVAQTLEDVVQQLDEARTQLNVLLSYSDLEESRQLARQFPQFAIVVSAGGPEDPHGEPEKIGNTLLVTVGQKGKYAGVLAVYPESNDQRFRFELVDLNRDHFRHDPAMDEIMREYQETLRDNLAEVFDLPERSPPHEGTYVGAAKCGECHTQAFAKWKETSHARAYHSLTTGRMNFEGTWVSRTHDPECLSCHVTGWHPQEVLPFTSGFLPQEVAAERGESHRYDLLLGQQCENCHGPGSRHVEVMEQWRRDNRSVSRAEYAAASALMKRTPTESLCIQCHDYENSPDFDFQTYWPKIAHPGRN